MNIIIVAFKDSKNTELGIMVFNRVDDPFFDFLVENKDITEISENRVLGYLKNFSDTYEDIQECSHIVKKISQLYSCFLFIEAEVIDSPMGFFLKSILSNSNKSHESLPISLAVSGTSSKLISLNLNYIHPYVPSV